MKSRLQLPTSKTSNYLVFVPAVKDFKQQEKNLTMAASQ